MSLHRHPGEESIGLYPGLVVSDGDHSRVTGSITVGRSRLPLWAFIGCLPEMGWSITEDYYDDAGEYEATFGASDCGGFLHNLMQHRGEFARLILVMADAERLDRFHRPWWTTKRHRKRVGDQLRRCVALLEQLDAEAVAGREEPPNE